MLVTFETVGGSSLKRGSLESFLQSGSARRQATIRKHRSQLFAHSRASLCWMLSGCARRTKYRPTELPIYFARPTLRAEFIAFDSYGRTLFGAAKYRAMDRELHGARIVEKNGPGHRKLDRRTQSQHGFGGEADSAARYVHGPACADFGEARGVEHLVSHVLLDGKTQLAPPVTTTGRDRPFVFN
jgi:hypothetical protein